MSGRMCSTTSCSFCPGNLAKETLLELVLLGFYHRIGYCRPITLFHGLETNNRRRQLLAEYCERSRGRHLSCSLFRCQGCENRWRIVCLHDLPSVPCVGPATWTRKHPQEVNATISEAFDWRNVVWKNWDTHHRIKDARQFIVVRKRTVRLVIKIRV